MKSKDINKIEQFIHKNFHLINEKGELIEAQDDKMKSPEEIIKHFNQGKAVFRNVKADGTIEYHGNISKPLKIRIVDPITGQITEHTVKPMSKEELRQINALFAQYFQLKAFNQLNAGNLANLTSDPFGEKIFTPRALRLILRHLETTGKKKGKTSKEGIPLFLKTIQLLMAQKYASDKKRAEERVERQKARQEYWKKTYEREWQVKVDAKTHTIKEGDQLSNEVTKEQKSKQR